MSTPTTALQVRNVTVSFGDHTVVDNATLTANPGEITGLIGPNGAGKTTLFKAMAGLTPHTGAVTFDDTELTSLSTKARARQVALIPQQTSAGFGFSVDEVVGLGRHPYLGRFKQPAAADRAAIDNAIALTGLEHLRHRDVGELSGGQRQLVHIARCLAQDTPVLFADEPVSALDLRHQLQVLQLLRARADEGRVVVTVLHDLSQAARWCNRLIVLADGRIRAAGSPTEVLTPEVLEAHYGVSADIERSKHDWLSVTPLQIVDSG